MASGLAPIKPEFRRKAGARVVVEAVLGSTTPATAAASAAADAAQPGSRDQRPQQAQKKSRNQQRKVSVLDFMSIAWRIGQHSMHRGA